MGFFSLDNRDILTVDPHLFHCKITLHYQIIAAQYPAVFTMFVFNQCRQLRAVGGAADHENIAADSFFILDMSPQLEVVVRALPLTGNFRQLRNVNIVAEAGT